MSSSSINSDSPMTPIPSPPSLKRVGLGRQFTHQQTPRLDIAGVLTPEAPQAVSIADRDERRQFRQEMRERMNPGAAGRKPLPPRKLF